MLAFALITATVASKEILLTTFDGAAATTQKWRAVNDPVMGGKSVATFKVNATAAIGVFDGETKIVPSLKAPGFCNMQAEGATFADISSANAVKLVVRSKIDYTGFKVSFGPAPRSAGSFFASYKADFNITTSADWQTIFVPFVHFSSKWSGFTGEPTTKCSIAHPEVCPDAPHLAKLTSFELSAEGVEGKFNIEVKSIGAVTV
jgi:hypothetical protein